MFTFFLVIVKLRVELQLLSILVCTSTSYIMYTCEMHLQDALLNHHSTKMPFSMLLTPAAAPSYPVKADDNRLFGQDVIEFRGGCVTRHKRKKRGTMGSNAPVDCSLFLLQERGGAAIG